MGASLTAKALQTPPYPFFLAEKSRLRKCMHKAEIFSPLLPHLYCEKILSNRDECKSTFL